jgi:hypothetical protein
LIFDAASAPFTASARDASSPLLARSAKINVPATDVSWMRFPNSSFSPERHG